MKTRIFVLTLLFIGFAFNGILAQTTTPKVKDRQIHQQKRIHKGVKSGEITGKEYVGLQKQQRNVQKHKKAAKADGKVTRRERARIHAHQNKASANVYRAKHNKRKRKH